MHFVIFPFPLRVTHLMVRLKLPYERHVSQVYIYLRTRRPKKSDSLLFQLNVVHILSLHMGASNPCVEVLGMPRVLRTDHGNHPQLKGAHTVHMTHNMLYDVGMCCVSKKLKGRESTFDA